MRLLIGALAIALWNIPFGYWRANVEKLSRQWFIAIHLPIPCIIALRLFGGFGWEFATYPVFIGSFFLGQYLGGKLLLWRKRRTDNRVSSCLVWDIVRKFQSG